MLTTKTQIPTVANRKEPSPTILNVDDNESMRYARRRILSQSGYRVIDAATGEEALLMAASHRPELIVLDVNLPGIDGLEVCRHLKGSHDTSHIMVLQVSSVLTSKMDLAAGLEGGADSYLIEPIEPLELLATVKALLRLAQREQDNRRLIQQLSRSDRQFTEATNAADCGLWDWDIPSGKLEWFGAHERLAGMLPGGFSGKIDVFSEILHPDDRTRVWNKVQGTMDRGEEHFSDEYRFVHPDGGVHWMTARGRFFYNDAGQAVRMTGVVQDITERKRAEDFLRRITDIAPSILYVYDLEERRNVWGNKEMFAWLGYSHDQINAIAGDLLRSLVHPDDWPRYLDHAEKLTRLGDGEVGEFEYRMRHADGTYRWLHSRDTVFQRSGNGRAKQIAGSALDITDRKLAEDAMLAAHDTFRHLVEQSPFGVYAIDADFRLVQVSAGAQKVFENVRPLLGRDFSEVLHQIWPEAFACEVIARFRRTLDTGEPYRSPTTVERRHDIDELESYDWKIERVVLPDGRFGVVCHFYDLSERQRYEKQLAAAKQQLEATLSATEIGAWHWDLTDNRLITDRNLKRLFGLDESLDPPVEVYMQRIHPDDFARNQAAMERVVQDGGSYDQQFRVIRPDGTVRWLHSRGKVEAGDGERRSLVGVVLDITERQQAEEQLRESEGRLQLALQASATGVWDWNLLTDEVTWSGHIHPIFGVESFEGTREAFSRQVHPEDADRLWRLVNHSITEHVPLEAEFRIIRPSGEVRWVNNFGKAEYDGTGKAISLLGTVSDITERKVTEQELRQLKDELEVRVRERTKELLAAQERLMAATSQLSLTEQRERRKLARDLHDYLAQMLAVGQMKMSMLKKQIPSNPGNTTLMQGLDEVFQQALTYTRTLIAELSPPSLQDSGLPVALKWLSERFERDGLSVDVRVNCDSVPLAEEPAVVVFQAVRELLFNVMKHAGVDRATLTLTLSDNIMRVAVADQGKGSTSEALQRSAEPGHLGLVSVRERFRAMGGRVDVESLPGKGTTVTLLLPLARSAATDVLSAELSGTPHLPASSSFSTQTASHAQRGEPLALQRNATARVLLVDDHTLVRQGIRDLLASDDRIRVVGEASTCEEALMLAANLAPDVVITDINLPAINGIETTKRFKALHPQLAVIGLSVHIEPHIQQAMLSAGAETLLSKECAAEELTAAIIQAYGKRLRAPNRHRRSD